MKRDKSKPKLDKEKADKAEKEKTLSPQKSGNLSSETKSFMREGIEIAEREIGSPKVDD